MRISAQEALNNSKANRFGVWNHGSSRDVSLNENDASRRIHEGFARIVPVLPERKFSVNSRVFTIGSCFAREIEAALTRVGGNVVSFDRAQMDRSEFRDADGNVRDGFFHRFTPRAIWHEFKIAFDEFPGWDKEASLLFRRGDKFADFNYWAVKGFDESLPAHRVRRSLAREFVRRATESELVILTLGLVESWVHKPSGFHCNRIHPPIVARRPDEFELVFLDYEDTLFCLSDVYRMLTQYHRTGDFHMVITVSPVPLQTTFSRDDIVVANERSKAVLRTAAESFSATQPGVSYFPSFELVRFSDPTFAWRPDRMHVNRKMVEHVVRTFSESYFASSPLGIDTAV